MVKVINGESGTAEDVAIAFRAVSKRYGKTTALSELDLDIRPGEFLSLLGPSGSGKTTTLNILAGLLKPDGGRVLIKGKDVTDLPPEKRDIAMVFQNYALYPHMSVADNLAFPLRAPTRRVASADIVLRVQETAELLGIAPLLKRFPREISGGQQQRVALGRAIIRDPDVFLLDEPLSNLDTRLRLKMRRDLKALHQRVRSTIVYVTHDQGEAMSLSDRIAIYQGGKLQQVAAPNEIYRKPANLFVANFMGEREMNNLYGRIAETRENILFRGEGLSIELGPSDGEWKQLIGREVVLGIRPEGVCLEKSDDSTTVQGEVILVEPSGADQIFYARAGDVELCGRCDVGKFLTVGETLPLFLIRREIYLFDQQSQRTLARHGGVLTVDAT